MKRPTLAIIAFTAATAAATAQDLDGQITVDREIVTVEHDAVKLNVLPRITLPQLRTVRLDVDYTAVPVQVAPVPGFLEPTEWDAIEFRHRGYAYLGYFPSYNLTAGARYLFKHTDATDLGGWLRYDGTSYRSNSFPISGNDASRHWRDHCAAAGIDLAAKAGEEGLLNLSIAYQYDHYDIYELQQGSMWQSTNELGIDARFDSKTDAVDYTFGLEYSHFGFGKNEFADVKPSQNRFTLGGEASVLADDDSRVGLDVSIDVLATSKGIAWGGIETVSRTQGIVSLTPFYRYSTDEISLSAGPRLDITANGGKALHLAPEVTIGWAHPQKPLAVSLTATGGERFTTYSYLHQMTPRLAPFAVATVSNVPLRAELQFVAGPMNGSWLRLFAGWAKANNWAMPTLFFDGDIAPVAAATWASASISGYRLGLQGHWAASRYVAFEAGYACSPSAYSKAWIDNYDRARHVADLKLEVRPINVLRLWATYTLRASRRAYADPLTSVSLSNESLLALGGVYDINSRLSAWLRGENLLNRRYLNMGLTPAQGVTAMVGIAYKL